MKVAIIFIILLFQFNVYSNIEEQTIDKEKKEHDQNQLKGRYKSKISFGVDFRQGEDLIYIDYERFVTNNVSINIAPSFTRNQIGNLLEENEKKIKGMVFNTGFGINHYPSKLSFLFNSDDSRWSTYHRFSYGFEFGPKAVMKSSGTQFLFSGEFYLGYSFIIANAFVTSFKWKFKATVGNPDLLNGMPVATDNYTHWQFVGLVF